MRIAFVLASILAIAACSSGTAVRSDVLPERELSAAHDVVRVPLGQVLVVRVAANPTTGYSWAWNETAAAGVLAQDGAPVMAEKTGPQLVGAGGTQTWRFRAAKSGTGELRLDYRRPWESEVAPVQTQSWRIEVR